ncbi:amino acid adenylation domain-containing protein [Paracoccus aminophilus]|uniref:Putative non-ribosomal peptide synthetase n=1 Tax=Paracoccus aminophilus JCM 7686 TaxID=1367847 RepID=S5XTR7_PARAH|nr:amino acid adenylation domain-containing protein [Paracoccus aminophilus]AGT10914.1 putative non-ribosomal peptide synthetase [Paracoccus aminophilus JCM 7686]
MSERANLHLIGIGGSGMLPLALLLKEAGHRVTGSDNLCPPARLAALEAQGIVAVAGADPRHILAADCVVVSPAIPETHVERRAARRAGLAVKTRAEALAELIAARPSICVASSHGKSTTTAMLIEILSAAARNDAMLRGMARTDGAQADGAQTGGPQTGAAEGAFGYMLGASFPGSGSRPARPSARWGAPDAPFVTEACEAHGALPFWRPTHAILTNLDDDHADHYGGLSGLRQAFAGFVARLPPEGQLVACGDDPHLREILRAAAMTGGRRALTYGFGAANALRAREDRTGRTDIFLYGTRLGALALAIPGRHNLLNALAALGMALGLGVAFPIAANALAGFHGIARRLQRIPAPKALRLFDDFAHHPAEIAASLRALKDGAWRDGTARAEAGPSRLIAVLEPQLHSRVAQMAQPFARALAAADQSYLLPVAALGETAPRRDGAPQDGATQDGNTALAEACRAEGIAFRQVADRDQLLRHLRRDLRRDFRPGDTLIVMAGASGADLAPWLARALSRPSKTSAAPALLLGARRAAPPDLLALVAAHAARDPAAPAVEMGTRRLSYGDLMNRVADLAAALRAAGIQPGESLGVCLGRSVDRVTAFLGALRLGAVFVPLDPALPEERLRLMLETAGVRRVVVNAASPALPEMGLGFINCGLLPERAPGATAHLLPIEPHVEPPIESPAQALAYMIFTSGTTGRPKAVEISRAALAHYATAAARHFEITPAARVSQLSGFGFDVSLGDMAMALAAGATLVYPTDVLALPGPPLGRFISEARLTHLSLTPSALSAIPPITAPALSHVITAGEACPPALVARWGAGRRFINAYGPTEATVEALFADCTPGAPITIGQPIDNMGACVMDATLAPLPAGAPGELCLFGPGLALGYRDQPELTAARFPTVDLPGLGPTRIYRSGDRVVLGPDGRVVYLGRIDNQLKFKGYRIEAGEIEAALCDLPGIAEAVVSLFKAPQMPDRLIAHLVAAPGAPAPDPADLRARLSLRLPAYMVPSVFLPVPEIARNANGKRDRGALPVPPQLSEPAPPRRIGTRTEARIMTLIDALFGAGLVTGTRDSLHDIGLDSLAMANLLFAIEERFAVTLDASFEAGLDTVEMLALMVDAQAKAAPEAAAPGLEDRLIARIMPYLAAWPGEAFGPRGLVRSLSANPMRKTLFWCFQGGHELAHLSASLGEALSLYGLRSGHLAIDYSGENLATLGRIYADEIAALAPSGPLYLGGNCQGGLVMRETALELMRRGREIALTVLMEQGRFLHYPGATLLLFGAQSYLNPYAQLEAPDQLFRTAYPGGHQVEILPGAHGRYFTPQHVDALAAVLQRQIARHPGHAEVDGAEPGSSADCGTVQPERLLRLEPV